MRLNLADCALDEKGKEDFLAKTDNFHDVFINRHLKLKDETPFLYDHIQCMKNKRKSYKKKWIDLNI